jgi:hypothetical protein
LVGCCLRRCGSISNTESRMPVVACTPRAFMQTTEQTGGCYCWMLCGTAYAACTGVSAAHHCCAGPPP